MDLRVSAALVFDHGLGGVFYVQIAGNFVNEDILWAVWLLCLACVALAFAYHNYGLMVNDRPTIVFDQETKVKREPNLRSKEVFILHEDTKVQV
jgi:hypothetical protein